MSVKELKRLHNVNHVAFRCRDAEQTRWFYEDVLGLPLAIAFWEETEPGTGVDAPFMHLFFQLGNGDFVAFFDDPSRSEPEDFEPAHSFSRHLAFQVDNEEELLAWQKSINDKGVSCLGPVDHGWVLSCYMYDPNGLQVEVTSPKSNYGQYLSEGEDNAHKNLEEWQGIVRKMKEDKFGAAKLDQRSRQK